MSIKIKSTVQEVQNWVDENEIYDLLKAFGMVNDLYVKTNEKYTYTFKEPSKKDTLTLVNQKDVRITTSTNYDSFYEVSYAA